MRAFYYLVLVVFTWPPLAAVDGVDYLRDVKPLFKARCYACHGGLKQNAGLRLDTAALVREGGDRGSIVDSGASSVLMQRVTAIDEAERMPPEGKPLTVREIDILKRWIEAGASGPADEKSEADPRLHWAFQKPRRAPTPKIASARFAHNPIDAFIAAEHESRQLTPLPPASPRSLLRRLYLDLVGVPPTPAELNAFLSDLSEEAYFRVVDRLLSDPRYGERWGRHWMDVWRYSDWYGRRKVPDVLVSYAQIWRWRDWIVRSLNDDKGYDRMVTEMLAADEIAPDDEANVVATGFVVRNFYRWNYNTWMKDSVEHTGKAFLALTLNCAHCHDHKYDPIAQEEYFRFRAFFEPLDIRHDRVKGEPDPGPYPKYDYGKSYGPISGGLVRVADAKLDAETFFYTKGEARNVVVGRSPLSPGGPAILGGDRLKIETVDLPLTAWYPGLKPFIQEEEIAAHERAVAAAKEKLAATSAKDGADVSVDKAELELAEAKLRSLQARIVAENIRYLGRPGDDRTAIEASRLERRAQLAAAKVELLGAERTHSEAKQNAADSPNAANQKKALANAEKRLTAARTAVDEAQNALQEESTTYSPIGPQYPKESTGRRAALARWIANEENPLTARVAVNHLWLRHFGQALVKTTYDFGRNGARPTHAELLDWLAVEFMENGWSTKYLHRLMVTSATYQLASYSGKDHPNAAIDRDNAFLWHFKPGRMDAEVVRDSVLHVAGELDPMIGGHEIDHQQGLTSRRRSIYFAHHGEGKMEFLTLFDAPDPCDAYLRTSSVRPQQALALLNSELALRQSRLLARKLTEQLTTESGERSSGELERFVSLAFERILSRPPSPQELSASREFLEQQMRLFSASPPPDPPSEKTSEPPKDEVAPSRNPVARARESFVHALFSHNEFVTVR